MSTKRLSKKEAIPPDTSEFDQEFVIDTFHSLSAEDKKRWKKVRGKSSRSGNGKESDSVTVHLGKRLLAQVDTLANKLGMSREAVITRGIKAVLAANDEF